MGPRRIAEDLARELFDSLLLRAWDAENEEMKMSEHEIVHIVDEDGVEPICRIADEGDGMWFFFDDTITCPRCRRIWSESVNA